MATQHRILGRVVIGVGVAIAALLFICALTLKPFTMPTASEQPTLTRGDYFFALKAPFYATPRRGDLLVFKLPSSGAVDYVKRLIGMPGDRVQLRAGQLYINDLAVRETPIGMGDGELPTGAGPVKFYWETTPEGRSYEIQRSPDSEPAGDTAVYTVPAHCYFVLGDNRDDSIDSRFDPGLAPSDPKLGGCAWDDTVDAKVGDETGVGFVPQANLVGRAAFILLSWNTGEDEDHPCCASLFKPWSWFTDARPSRFFKVLH
jgi:signal peptidase I